MGQSLPTRQSDDILPPIAPVCLTVSSVVVVDMTTFPQSPVLNTQAAGVTGSTVAGSERTVPFDQYLTFQADGDCFVAFGANAAAVTSITSATVNTVTANAIQTATNTCFKLVGGVRYDFRLPAGPNIDVNGRTVAYGTQSPARFMGAVAGSSTTLRIFVSSR